MRVLIGFQQQAKIFINTDELPLVAANRHVGVQTVGHGQPIAVQPFLPFIAPGVDLDQCVPHPCLEQGAGIHLAAAFGIERRRIGRQAGMVEDFKGYGDSLVAAGEAGLVWDEENFVKYAEDPKKFLAEYLDDKGARSKMSFKLRKGAEDVYAYLVSVSPEPEEGS